MWRWLSAVVVVAMACGGGAAQEAGQTGAREISATSVEVLGAEAAAASAEVLGPNQKITWEIYAPSRDDRSGTPGVLVYISPSKSGRPRREWLEVMKAQNLIWIGANLSGNETPTDARIMMALMARELVGREYEIDAERVYLSGFSGGGRTAGIMMGLYPQLFRGAIYICGVNFWEDTSVEIVEQIRENAYVFLTGSLDFNRAEVGRVFGEYKSAEVDRVLAMDIRGLGHELPSAPDLSTAIDFLDGETGE